MDLPRRHAIASGRTRGTDTGRRGLALVERPLATCPTQLEVEVSRRHPGIGGDLARYLIVTIPPMQAVRLPPSKDLVADNVARRFKTAD